MEIIVDSEVFHFQMKSQKVIPLTPKIYGIQNDIMVTFHPMLATRKSYSLCVNVGMKPTHSVCNGSLGFKTGRRTLKLNISLIIKKQSMQYKRSFLLTKNPPFLIKHFVPVNWSPSLFRRPTFRLTE